MGTISQPTYQRLPGVAATLTHYYSLYLGPTYLLQVASTGWSERYRRFYFQDIRAIVLRRTNAAGAVNAVLAGLALPFLALALFNVAPLPMLILAITCAVPLIYSLLAGPSCVCHIYTSVQVERLPSLRRLRVAHRALSQLRPRIEQAQSQPALANPSSTEPTARPGSEVAS